MRLPSKLSTISVKLTASVVSARDSLRCFVRDELGEIAPASYIGGFMLAVMIMFFAMDLGMRKGARLSVEYAAYCAARAAATQIPQKDADQPGKSGACVDGQEKEAITHAAAACLAATASKRSVFFSLQIPGTISRLINQTKREGDVKVRLLKGGRETTCFAHNDPVTAEVSYRHNLFIPLSALSLTMPRGLVMKAQATQMLHSVR